MNLILFEDPFEQLRLSANDLRTRHILTVLKIEIGDFFYIGFVTVSYTHLRAHET